MLFLTYILKSATILGIMLLYYQMVLKKQTFFNLNRIYLLGSVIFAVCIPFIQITLTVNENVSPLPVLPANFLQEIETASQPEHIQAHGNSLYDYLKYIYWAGVFLFGLHYLSFWNKLFWLSHEHPHKKFRGLYFILLQNKNHSTFSVFNRLYINTQGLDKENKHKIFEHEKIHIRQLHSLDLHLLSILCIFNWFNPLIWIFKKAIVQNHEYIADRQVVRRFQTGSYLRLLVNQTLKGDLSFSNGFSCSNLKKRMIMMTQKQTPRYRIWYYIPAFILSGVLFLSFSCIVTGKPAIAKPAEFFSETIKTLAVQSQDTAKSEVFQAVEEMPQFSEGSPTAWINKHIKYPVEAIEKGIGGKVYVSFIITKTGKIRDAKIAKGANPLLDAEALRVIRSMPAWTPGKQKGQAVDVQYTLPINFGISKPAAPKQQTDTPAPKADDIFQVVETMPRFNGNQKAWLQENLRIPAGVDVKTPVRTYVQYVIFEDGTIHNAKISKSSGNTALDNEALRVINAMPAWTPGKQRGQAVKVAYTLPIVFEPTTAK